MCGYLFFFPLSLSQSAFAVRWSNLIDRTLCLLSKGGEELGWGKAALKATICLDAFSRLLTSGRAQGTHTINTHTK